MSFPKALFATWAIASSWTAVVADNVAHSSSTSDQVRILATNGTLHVYNKYISPDGFNRSAIVVNGVHPSPLIKAKQGGTFSLNLVNEMKDPTMLRSTSVHWHGLFQHGAAWADGSESITQCPVSPGREFLYHFPTGYHPGTFWYHSHFGTQYCDGLRGPLVVYDDNDPYKDWYDVDDEHTIITLVDWYHTPAPSIVPPAFADSTLINGKGRAPGGPNTELAVVNVKQGKRYRFRLLSLACESNFQFSIDGHRLKVIEADGHLTEPLYVDRLQIFAGQRYSFILKANQPIGNYWIRALPNFGNNGLTEGLTEGFKDGINSAILRYAAAPEIEPLALPVSPFVGKQLLESELHALHSAKSPGLAHPGGADINIRLDLGINMEAMPPHYTVNNGTFEPPSVPILLQIMSGARNAADILPKGGFIPLERNKIVELTVPGGVVGGPHPFHLHGHAFSVVKSAGSSTYNFENPVRRDVVNSGEEGEETVIRFVTDNPGPWIFHCHVELHLRMGLAVVFAEDMDSIAHQNASIPAQWHNLCPIYNSLSPEETFVQLIPPPAAPAEPAPSSVVEPTAEPSATGTQ
ncbi:laccase 4 [Coprinopsis marcescibilis]|uniref:Laccase 4 n=1 Tax=Coprinopsis marcescibilis TaxID=230819 RepID=A0A5C3KNS2_COPMA|nr:laccase 4 [Coprinopsis marcescibilis]